MFLEGWLQEFGPCLGITRGGKPPVDVGQREEESILSHFYIYYWHT